MKNGKAGQVKQVVGGYPGMDTQSAAKVAHDLLLSAAKTSTAVAFCDTVNLAGQNWLKAQGMHINFADGKVTDACRMLLWNGTPHMGLTDLSECLALLGDINSFEAARVVLSLRDLRYRCPKLAFEFRLAREFSPAIYVRDVNFTTLPNSEIVRVAREIQCDDASIVLGNEVRFWFE